MSQAATILRLLTEARGEWVELTTLAREAGCYAISERVSELRRKHGYPIENQTYQAKDNQKHSRYRLLPAMVDAPSIKGLDRCTDASPATAGAPATPATNLDLFPHTTYPGADHHDY